MRKCIGIGSAVVLVACLAVPLYAQTKEEDGDLRTTVEALKQRLREQDRLLKAQEERLAELEQCQKAAATQPATQAMRDAQREAIKEVLKEMKIDADKRSAMPAWMENLKFSGDMRLRYELNNYNWGSTSTGEKDDRNRARFRLRFGVTKTWLEDQVEVGFRLASGSDNDPTSTNQSFSDNFSKKPVWIDQAYAKYSPKDLKGFTLIGGKMARPWVDNEIFFDGDVNPEGFWAEYKTPKLGALEPFVGAGYFIVSESADSDDATLYTTQAGVKAGITKDVKYTLAGAYQEWTDYYASGGKPRGNDSPLSRVPGFRVFKVSNNLDIADVLGKPVNFFADFAHNCGEDDEATQRYDGENNAFAVGAKYGQNKKKGDWSLKYRYAFVEANALPGQFVDSDFGFANRQGHVLGGEYNLLDSLTIGVSVLMTEPITSPTTNSGSSAFEDLTTTVLADLVWKF